MRLKPRVRATMRYGVAFLLLAVNVLGMYATPAAALPTSVRVAYIFDFGSGVSDPNFLGSNIFVNAITGSPPPGGVYTPAGGSPATFVNVPVSQIDTLGVAALASFDSALLYQVCDIGAHPNTVNAINTYLMNGNKVMIYDGDRCAPGFGGLANYSSFLFPFATSSPGPQGASGSYIVVDPSTLTTGLAVGPQPGDSVGDANTFTTFNGAWCRSITATNTLGNTGFVEAYARALPGNGLVIYEGEDFWFSFGPTPHLKLVFDNILKQGWNPDGLPCLASASGITLSPASATNPVGGSHTVTATVTDVNNHPVPGVTVTFSVLSGPNAGKTGTAVTNASGQAAFTYSDTGGAGTDNIQARFTDAAGNIHTSNTATKTWTQPAGHSLALNGIDGYADTPGTPDLNITGDWTVESWFKDEDPAGFNHDFRQIIMKGDNNANPEGPYYILVGNNHLLAGVRSGGVNYPIDADLAFLGLDPSKWHHVAVTFRASSNELNLSLDGNHISFLSGVPASSGNTLPLNIGRNGPTTGKYWNGKLDDVRIWKVVRSDAEISANFMQEFTGPPPANLVANWQFDESSGTTASDYAGTHIATLHGGASFSPDHPQVP